MQHVARMLTYKQRCVLGDRLVNEGLRITVSRHSATVRAFSWSAMVQQQQSAAEEAAADHKFKHAPAPAGDRLGKPLLSVAPMMDWTDIHYRQLARLISKHTWLWTEMVVDRTILHAEPLDKYLWFPPEQHPIVLQLGGSDPQLLHQAAAAAAAYGYDELNLNCGCPSDRVAAAGCFGAALMLEPQLVADCMAAIAAGAAAGGASSPRISVKCRLGVDDADSYGQLARFVQVVSEAGGVRHFVIHARKCLLNGLSPAQNRSVPPLRHDWVWALKRDFPHLCFQLNGGISSSYAAVQALNLHPDSACGVGPGVLDGVMIGRAAYNDPWGVLGDADVAVFGAAQNAAANRRQVVEAYCVYADAMLGRWRVRDDGSQDPNIRTLVKPLLNLFHGERGGKRWKNAVDIALRTLHPTSVSELLAATLSHVPDDVLDAPPRPAAEAAAVANNGVLPGPYTLAVDRLALPEDLARGEREPRRKPRGKGKAKALGAAAGSDSEADEGQQVPAECCGPAVQQQQEEQQQQQVAGEVAVQQQVGALRLQHTRFAGQQEQQQQQQQQQSSLPGLQAAAADSGLPGLPVEGSCVGLTEAQQLPGVQLQLQQAAGNNSTAAEPIAAVVA